MTFPQKQYNEPVMVPGMGAQPMPAPKYVPANDNIPQPEFRGYDGFTVGDLISSLRSAPPTTIVHAAPHEMASGGLAPRGQYIGLRRSVIADSSKGGFDIPPELQPAVKEMLRGPFIQVYPARKFFPFDPRPEDVFIESIAHGLSNICRYSGACDKHFSVAEHSTLIARYLAARYAPEVALAGLLHDAPEALSGFGDVGRPVKGRAPTIGETEDGIWRKAVAPRFGLPLDIPAEVHEADNRILADEIAANLAPMEWQAKHNDPLGVNIRCWSPEKAEIEFLATFDALTGRSRRAA
ncbi:hypothetical protein GGE68_002908 [Rhizobium leguminosarum]|uniref:hypothetical protein n=1 Tax=Rhizobium leguminosarum TaxID=384 RepID=UPI001615A01D|nr:hypothetical protein [Rhizobium leguminosarum]MBB5664711.1 hypothetical protein [Rhizobium leguminosarum]